MRRGVLGAALVALATAGCGDDRQPEAPPSARPAPPGAGASEEAGPPPTTTRSQARPGREPDGRTDDRPARGEDQPGGGGDANALVPAAYELGTDGRLRPRTIGVPEFLGIRLVVRSTDDESHRVRLGVDPPVALTVAPGAVVSREVMGQREGRFAVTVDGERAGTLVVGVEPGP